MESVEIIVYMGIAIIVGSMFIFALTTMDWRGWHHQSKEVFVKEESIDFKIKFRDFGDELAKRWEDCKYGMENITYSIFVTDNGTVDYSYVVKELRRHDHCDMIDCRNRTGQLVVNGSAVTPKIINIRCWNNTLLVNSR